MSDLSEQATLSLLLADYASMSEVGKLNMIGGGVSAIGFDAVAGVTNRFTLIASTHAPGRILPAEGAIDIGLYREGQLVEMEQPGGPQPLRIGQPVRLEKPTHAGISLSHRDGLMTSHHILVDFSNGLPLNPDTLYEWRMKIDMDEDRTARFPFAVLGATVAPPVLG